MSSNQPPSTVQSPCAYSRNRYSECTCLLSNHLLQYNPPMPAVWTNTQWEQAASILLVQNFSGKLSLYFCIWATSPPSNTLDAAHIFIYFLFWKAAAVVLVIGQKEGRKEERQRERERELWSLFLYSSDWYSGHNKKGKHPDSHSFAKPDCMSVLP